MPVNNLLPTRKMKSREVKCFVQHIQNVETGVMGIDPETDIWKSNTLHIIEIHFSGIITHIGSPWPEAAFPQVVIW